MASTQDAAVLNAGAFQAVEPQNVEGGWIGWIVFNKTKDKQTGVLHPKRLIWNLRIRASWKRKIIFQSINFRFYVELQGCYYLTQPF